MNSKRESRESVKKKAALASDSTNLAASTQPQRTRGQHNPASHSFGVSPELYGGLIGLVTSILANFMYDLMRGGIPHIGPLKALAAIALVIAGTAVGHYKRISPTKKLFWALLSVAGLLLLVWALPLCPDCPVQGASEHEVILATIRAEADAVRRSDMDMIRRIFSQDAVIIDVSNGTHWRRDERYTALLHNAQFLDANQFEFQPVVGKSTDDKVVFTTGSSGRLRDNEGQLHEYYNRPGSNEWTLQKNPCGCWVIQEFRFNLP